MRVHSHATDESSLRNKAPNPTDSATTGYSLTAFAVPLLPRPQIQDVGSGASLPPNRQGLLKAARRRELDRIIVWRLGRWGRSLLDLISTLQELASVNVGFVSLSEALDLTTPSGRALAG